MKVRLVKASEFSIPVGTEVGFDIETTGVEIDSKVCVISVYNPILNEVNVIPLKVKGYRETQVGIDHMVNVLKDLVVFGHFLQFDLSICRKELGFQPKVGGDSFLMARVLQWKENGLKDIAEKRYPDHKFNRFGSVVNEGVALGDDEVAEISPDSYEMTKDFLTYCLFDAYLPYKIIREEEARPLWVNYKRAYELEISFLNCIIQT